MEESERQPQQADVFMDGEGRRRTGPQPGQLVADPQPQGHRQPQDAERDERRGPREIPVDFWFFACQ